MSLRNEEIARLFEEWADLLALTGTNQFRIGAYRRAAQIIRSMAEELGARIAAGFDPDSLPGIGPDLAHKITALADKGHCPELERLRAEVPAGLRDLLQIPGIGAHRARALYDVLKIHDVAGLRVALDTHRVRTVPGFGPALERQLSSALQRIVPHADRFARGAVAADAAGIRAQLASVAGVVQVAVAGSYRRGSETVGDLDFVVCADASVDVGRALQRYPGTISVLAAGATRTSVVLRSGLQVDVRVVPTASFGAALYYSTGNRAHNIHLRRLCVAAGLKLNEYGVFRGEERMAGSTEASVLGSLNLPFIAPELREDRGEIEAAQAGHLPELIERSQLQGDLHVHTSRTDGTASLEEMAAAAASAGLGYIAITDHAKHLGITHGLDASALMRQIDAIDRYNALHRGMTLFKGIEVDILPDGSLALSDAVLARLDLVVAAVHGSFNLSRRRQTDRLLRALDHPCVSILAHPTTRLLQQRLPIEVDWAKVFRRASARPCYLELNAQPTRLDLDDVLVREAAASGILISIASDAHGTADFAHLEGGVLQARRGWLGPAQVLNARPAAEVRKLLAATMQASHGAARAAR